MQGLPLSLSGVRKIMNMMDWGDIGEFVSFGEVGRNQIDKASYYILVAPQNVVGNTILTNLGDMVSAFALQCNAVPVRDDCMTHLTCESNETTPPC